MLKTAPTLSRAGLLLVGLGVGWAIGQFPRREAVILASASDRSGESIVATGPVTLGYNEGAKVQIPLDALYYLDCKGGRLLATIPSYKMTIGKPRLIDNFAVRDLVADFKINLEGGGPRPRFAMTTGTLGTYSEGWAPLYVFETTSAQVAVYKVDYQIVGTKTTPKFELLEIQSLPQPTPLDKN